MKVFSDLLGGFQKPHRSPPLCPSSFLLSLRLETTQDPHGGKKGGAPQREEGQLGVPKPPGVGEPASEPAPEPLWPKTRCGGNPEIPSSIIFPRFGDSPRFEDSPSSGKYHIRSIHSSCADHVENDPKGWTENGLTGRVRQMV